eukprot:Phypoly_transcript_12012.p1 GENE.Phypoly_transcript_12012~~Phypoly_transcript_12012.p1  ORF type:complete len:259 (+),score=22.23 Phypoly_transcript_12012:233-1009(+)
MSQDEITKLRELYEMNFIQESEYKTRLAELTGAGNHVQPLQEKFGALSFQKETPEILQNTNLTTIPASLVPQAISESRQFNVFLWGDAGVGKTTFVEQHFSGEFLRIYQASQTVKIIPLHLKTNIGNVVMNIHDIPGKALYDPSVCPDILALVEKSQGAILMFDNTSMVTYQSIKTIFKKLEPGISTLGIVIIGNKVDSKDRKVKAKDIVIHRQKNAQYYDVSVKSSYNFVKPLIYLLRRMTGNADADLIEAESSQLQ